MPDMMKLLDWRRRESRGRTSRRAPEGQVSTSHDEASGKPQAIPSKTVTGPSTAKDENIDVHFPDGVHVWRDCPDATVDICFVHGLTGNRDSTWTAHGQPEPWPALLLPSHLPRARLLTYGYDAYILRRSVTSQNRLLDHATNLVSDLTNDRMGHASSRPLIFVAHSLGGLICKEAILHSRDSPDDYLRGIFDSFSGIIFMGTPHKGSWMANWAKIPASALGLIKSTNTSLLAVLGTEDQLLESNQVRFWSMIRRLREGGRQIDVTCFYEELPIEAAGLVVSKQSATLDGYNSISIHANHRDMVKISSTDETSFKRLRGELIRWEQSVREGHLQTASQPTDHFPGDSIQYTNSRDWSNVHISTIGNVVAAVSRHSNTRELWFIAADGSVLGECWHADKGRRHYQLAPTGSASPSSSMAAVSRRASQMELWFVANDGSVQDFHWYEGHGWRNFQLAPAGSASPTGGIAAVSRTPQTMDLWFTSYDGSVQYFHWSEGHGWKGSQLAPAGSASPTGTIAAISRRWDTMEIFFNGPDGSIPHYWWYESSSWGNDQLAPPNTVSKDGGITAISRAAYTIEMWAVCADGSVREYHLYENIEWRNFQLAPSGSAVATAGICAASRSNSTMELFFVGSDGSVRDYHWHEHDGEWKSATLAPHASASITTGMKAISRSSNTMEVCFSGNDRSIHDYYYDQHRDFL